MNDVAKDILPPEPQLSAIQSEPDEPLRSKFRLLALWLGVFFPLAVILFEMFSGFCADNFFDPIPTLLHQLLVLLVPASNLLLWLHLNGTFLLSPRRLLLLSACALGVASYYTLLFLPLMPLAVIAIIVYGLGLLVFAPLASLIIGLKLNKILRLYTLTMTSENNDNAKPIRPRWHGITAGLIIMILMELPGGFTRIGIEWAADSNLQTQRHGLQLIRYFGDETLLLKMCYSSNRSPSGPLSLIMLLARNDHFVSSEQIRTIYYQVTGSAFSQQPNPFESRDWSAQFDRDQGGRKVGGQVKDLYLLSSKIDASVSGDDGVAYLEWQFVVKNDATFAHEARLQLALPPHSVVSRATLWINGEPQEAAFAGRAQVRQAYEKVVQRQHDPLLVTSNGADRVLLQAFPVESGGSIQFRVGITVPLSVDELSSVNGTGPDKVALFGPRIIDSNFSIATKHLIWLESKQPLHLNDPMSNAFSGFVQQQLSSSLYRLRGSLTDNQLNNAGQWITVERDPNVTQLVVKYQAQTILQQTLRIPNKAKDTLMIVVDGSAGAGQIVDQLVEALNQIPMGKNVGLIIAGDERKSVAVAP